MKKFLDYLNRKRLEITKPFITGSILDVGCGPATTYKDLQPKEYVGIELNENDVKRLKEKFPLAKFYSRNLEKDKLNLNQKFDTVILLAVIEHIKYPDNMIIELKRCLKEKGKIIMTTPTPFGNFVHTILSKIGLTSKEAVEGHVNIYSHRKFINTARKYGLKIIKYQRFELSCNSLIVLGK